MNRLVLRDALVCCSPVSLDGDDCPDRLNTSERPRAREKPIRARECTTKGERQDEARSSPFQGIHEHHEREDNDAVGGESHEPTVRVKGARTLTVQKSGGTFSVEGESSAQGDSATTLQEFG